MLFIDTDTENTRKEIPIPRETLGPLMEGLDYHDITG